MIKGKKDGGGVMAQRVAQHPPAPQPSLPHRLYKHYANVGAAAQRRYNVMLAVTVSSNHV